MAIFGTTATQTVAAGQNVLFTTTAVCGNCNIIHSVGSGQVTLRGSNNPCNIAKYKVKFGGNIAVATGGTVGEISVALAVNGEPIYIATASVTPAAVGEFNFVGPETIIPVPFNCCYTVTVQNVSDPATPIDVANGSISVERVC